MDDELIGPPKALPDFNLDPKTRSDLEKRRNARNIDLATQIAFMEYGVSKYLTDIDLCKAYGITIESLNDFKERHRSDIERYKDQHRYSKFKLFSAISETLTLRSAMVKAGIDGNKDMAKAIAETLTMAEKVVPFKTIKEMAEIMKTVEDEFPEESGGRATINVNVNQNMKDAQEAFEKRRREKIIDVKPEENK